MADDADRADPAIQRVVDAALARAKFALDNPRLRPVVQELDGIRFGICHYCESPVRPGHLFCPTDGIDPENSCAVAWEHLRRRTEAMGKDGP